MPERTCIRCRQPSPKRELLRLVWADGRVAWDPHQTAPGRGAYLHPACAELGVADRVLARALRVSGASQPPVPDVRA